MGAARIEGEVASDGADGLTGWVGREIKSVGCRCRADMRVDNAWLDEGAAIVRIHFEDSIEPIQAYHDAFFDGQGTSG